MAEEHRGRAKRVVQVAATMALLLGALFGGAGRIDWARGWIYSGAYVLGMTAAFLVMRRSNPELIEARSKLRYPNTKRFDKFFFAAYVPLMLLQPAVAGLDAVRFGWSRMPPAMLYAGVVLFAAAMALVAWTLGENPFAETTVRIQSERGHRVIGSGPYRFVRHPMYVGMVAMHLATALILGSWWALAAGGVIAVLYVWRTTLEDRMLRAELPGYQDFAAKTRYRLAPGVW